MKTKVDEGMFAGGVDTAFVQRNADALAEIIGVGNLKLVKNFDRVGKLRNVQQMIQLILNPGAAYQYEKYRGNKEEKWEQFNKYKPQ